MNKIGLVGTIFGIIGTIFGIWEHYENSLYHKDMDTLLREHNIPNVLIEQVSSRQWIGDKEPYLTISIINRSNEIAKNLKVQLMDIKGKTLKFTPTKAFSIPSVSIGPNKKWLCPIGPISEIRQIKPSINIANIVGSTVIGFGTRPLNPFIPNEKAILLKYPYLLEFPVGMIDYSYYSVLGSKLGGIVPLYIYLSYAKS